jgi:hypothetical protein
MKAPTHTAQFTKYYDREALGKLLVAFAVALALAVLVLVTIQAGFGRYGDLGVYGSYSHALQAGLLPYHNFLLEYPPGVLPPLLIAGWFGNLFNSFSGGFFLLSLLMLTVLLYHRFRHVGKLGLLEISVLLLPLLQFMFFELDIFAVLALYGAIWQFRKKRFKGSAALLALATLVKAYPGVCLIGLFWLVPKGQRKTYLKTFASVLLVVMIPLVILVPKGLWSSFTYHTGRPIEFEAGMAAIGYLGHLMGWSATIVANHGSHSLTFPGHLIWAKISTVALGINLLGIAWMTRQRRYWQNQPVMLCLTLLVAFILWFKVGSPQYLLAPLVLVPLAKQELQRQQYLWLFGRLLVISTVAWLEFVYFFRDMATFDTGGYTLLFAGFSLVRTVLLVELLVFLLRLGRPKNASSKAVHP